MYLSHLSLLNYRNFEELELDFSDKINCFIGNNGVGKTNILDSIYFLSFCKSWLNPIDIQNIKYNQDFFLIKGIYTMNESTETISCGIARGKKKSFKRNTKEYDRLSDHIGLIPLLTVSPYDSGLILGNSDERRKFMDIIISQFDKDYLQKLMKYNKVLQHRNQLLKQNPANVSFDRQIIEIWDEQLIFLGQQIYNKRMDYVKKIIPIFQDYYSGISAGKEQVGLEYKSQLSEIDYRKALAESLERDRLLQYTGIGIHKDDLLFTLHNSPLKKHASQGQQKTYLIALKLAQFDLILSIDKVKPILLFDDIFDKLDAERVRQIIHLLAHHHFGQIFISDTNKDRLDHILKQIGISYKLFILNGNIEETEVFLSS